MSIFLNAKGTTVPYFKIGKGTTTPTIQTGTDDPTVLPQPGVNGDLYIRYGGTSNQLWQYVFGTWQLYTNQPQIGVAYKTLNYTSGATTDIITLPANSIILNTEVSVLQSFNGATPTLDIGTSTDHSLLMANADIDLTIVNTDKNDTSFVLPGSGSSDVQAYFNPDSSTQGQLAIFIEYTSTTFSVPNTEATIVANSAALGALVPVVGQFAYVLDSDGHGNPATYIWTGSAWVVIASGGSGVSFPITAPDGSASVPQYSFINDGNMGMYRIGSHEIGFSTNSTERLRITDSGIGINQPSIAASAILDVASTTKGVLFPRMTTTQRNAISSPASSLLVYDTTLSSFYYYNGSSWAAIGAGGGGGSGTVTSVATDSTLTGGPITTTGTLGLNLSNENTWSGQQNFDANMSMSSGNYLLFNGDADTNWRMGLGISGFTTSLVGEATSLQIEVGAGTGGPDGFAVGNCNGQSIFELEGHSLQAYFAGAVNIAGSLSASNFSGSSSGTNTGDQTITLTGDITGSGTGSFATTLATVNSNVGTFGSSTAIPTITVNAKGLVTAVTTNAVIAPAGTLSGTALNPLITDSSLTSVGQLVNLTVTNPIVGSITGNAATATNVAYSGLTGTVPTWNQNTTGTAANITAVSNSTLTTLSALSLPYSQLSGTVPTWNQDTTGNAATVTTNANLTGPVTSVGNATTITNNAVTYTKMQQASSHTLLGNPTGSTANLSEITLGSGLSFSGSTLVATGAVSSVSNSDGTLTISPTSGAVVASLNLGNANTWTATQTFSNTISGSISGNAATASALSPGANINGVAFTGASNITVAAAAGTLTGTTLNSTVVSSSLTSVGTLANLTVTNPISGSITGNAATVTTNANLTGDVTSSGNATTLATVNSNVGTFNSVTVNAKGLVTAASNVSASTTLDTIGSTQGDILYRSGSAWAVLAPGTSGQVLTTGGASANPSWTTSTTGTVTSITAGTGLSGGTITSSGTIAVASNGITNSLFRQSAANSIVGNPTGSTANVTDITLGSTLTFSSGALQTKALSGDVTTSANSFVTTVSSYNGGTSFGTMAAQNASAVAITGGSITGMSTPTNGSDVATKSYVDNATAGLSQKNSCRVASTANLTATYANGSSGVGATLTNSGTQAAISIDSVSLNLNDRVLVKNQTTQLQNGIYTVTTVGSGSTNWVLTRATDYDQSSEILEGTYTLIEEGTSNAGTLWIETGTSPITIGTGSIVFTQLSVAPQTVSFTGDVTGTGAGSIALTLATVNSNVGTFSALTVNGKGLVTAATNLGLTGDVTGTASGSGLATTIAASSVTTSKINNSAVTYAKLQNETGSTILGNPTGSSAAPSEITLGSTLAFSGTALQTTALSGDVTTSANSFATTIASNAVTTSKINNSAVTYAKLQNETATTLLGNPTGSAAAPSEITLGSTLSFSGTAIQTGAITGDVTASANSFATTVAKINGATLGTTTATSGNLLIGSGSAWVTQAMSGDATISSTGAISVTKTGGVSFAASATTDTTNAANISSGTLPTGRLPALSGDLSSSAGSNSVTVAKINGVSLGTTTATSGNLLIGSGTVWATQAMSGDATINSTGAITVTKTNGTSFATSATTDTTNASNISSGSLSLSRIASIANNNLLANISGSSAAPSATTLTALIDSALGSTQGDILYRNASGWVVLAPGTSGQVLTTGGASANPSWAASGSGSGTVNSGTAGQVAYYSGTGTAVSGESLSSLIDSTIGSTQGDILYRSGSAWAVLAPGTSGQILQTNGASANPSWVTNSGGSSVINLQNQAFVSGTDFTPGTTTTLTLSSAPSNSSSLEIHADGVYQNHNSWSLSGSTVTFTSAIPLGTQRIEATWTVSASAPTANSYQDFVDGTDYTSGTSTTLTISSSPPLSAAQLLIYADGVYQNHNTWSLSGSIVTFNSAIPAGVGKIELIWTNAASGYASASFVQDFAAGTGFTAGTSTTITLNSAPPSAASLNISFDGVQQFVNTWSLSGSTVTFTSAIPYNVANIEARWITGAGQGVAITPAQGNSSTSIATTQFVTQNNTGGFINKIRNPVMQVVQRGTSGTITAGTPAYTVDGWILSSTGANITWSRGTGFSGLPTGINAPYFLGIIGNTGNTDITLTHRIESMEAADLAGQTVTLQFILGQSNGSTLTPTLTTKYAGSTDNWTSPVTDINAVSLQPCASGSNVLLCYTFTVSSNAINGYEIIIDLGAMNSNAKSLNIGSFDLRITPGVTTGLNSVAPPIEIRPLSVETIICQRYLYTLGSTGGGLPAIGGATSGSNFGLLFQFPVVMRSTPTQTVASPSAFFVASMSGAATAVTAMTGSTTSPTAGFFTGTVSSGLTSGQPYYLQCGNTSISGNIVFSAEL